ncbi:hypothetical protein ACGFMM_23925 [Streptomyces sp. NPDC048604]|uniref:hypothetical protein n=1 Tax=Streptomyces sp. NPDC048604 TaxID=3365578 RepID=UPI003721BD6F
MTPPTPPTRADVAAHWSALGRGNETREAVHVWTLHWVEGDGAFSDLEPPWETGLQYLHGFDLCTDPTSPSLLRHGRAGAVDWYPSHDAIGGGLARWQEMCDRYDADPEGWTRGIREQIRARAEGWDAGGR